MKRIFALITICLLCFSGCKNELNLTMVEKDYSRFYIDGDLPEIGDFSGKAPEHFYGTYTPDFIPSDSYGEIVPYISRYKMYSSQVAEGEEPFAKIGYGSYGFCTPDGKIVMDASDENSNVNYYKTNDGFEFYTLNRTTKSDIQDELYDGQTHVTYYVIPKSGKWCLKLNAENEWVSAACNGAIYVGTRDILSRESLRIYDYDGNYVKTLDNMSVGGEYSCGLMLVYVWQNDEVMASYINAAGEIVLGPYSGASSFTDDGAAIVYDENGMSYLIDTAGNKISEDYGTINAQYNLDTYQDVKMFTAKSTYDSTSLDVYKTDGSFVKTITADGYITTSFPDNGDMIYSYNADDVDNTYRTVWKRLSDDTDFVSKETGQMPNTFSENDNVFVYIDEQNGGGIVFDGDGETIARLSDMAEYYTCTNDGRYVVYRNGYTMDKAYELYGDEFYLGNVSIGSLCIYDTELSKVVFETESVGNAFLVGHDDRFILISCFNYASMYSSTTKYWLFDTHTGKIVLDDCDHIGCTLTADATYINVSKGNVTTLYNEDLDVIIRNYNE